MESQGSEGFNAVWRSLSISDISDLVRIATVIHPSLHESDEIFAERVKLFPEGCLALVKNDSSDELVGYAISHPIPSRQPPALDSLLKAINPNADQFYIHDVAVLPAFQGRGYAQQCLHQLFSIAARFKTTSLISVYETASFWNRYGFSPQKIDQELEEKLRGYGDGAIYLERGNKEHQSLEIGSSRGGS